MKLTPKKIVLCLMALSASGGLVAYLFLGRVPLWFNECSRQAVIVAVSGGHSVYDQYGTPIWPNWRYLFDIGECEPNEFEELWELEPNELTELWLIIDSFFSRESHVSWRNIFRDGEHIRVVYISFTETPITMIHRVFFSDRLRTQKRFLQTTAFQGIEHTPQTVEVYYLRNLHQLQRRIDRLSDEDFYALRMGATLVWSGVVGVARES